MTTAARISPDAQILEETEWMARRDTHLRRTEPLVRSRIERAFRHEKHPVEDFLFEYYAWRPAQLLRWHPGIGIALAGDSALPLLDHKGYHLTPGGVTADPECLSPERVKSVRWMLDMLRSTQDRPAFFRCHGLHEWAMVYRSESIRHEAWPLRFSPARIAEIIESLPVRCSHFDAFRFFTDEARPLNLLQPARGLEPDLEQPGCLHANMDLYKWAFKLAPLSPSELVIDAFELARDIRVLDMRASPYDFGALCLVPVAIETPEGRAEYETAQREFSLRAAPLRRELIALCEAILEHHEY